MTKKETTIDDVMDIVNFEFQNKGKRLPNLVLFPEEDFMNRFLKSIWSPWGGYFATKDWEVRKADWTILGMEVRVNENIPKNIVLFAHIDKEWNMREVEMFNLSNLDLWKGNEKQG